MLLSFAYGMVLRRTAGVVPDPTHIHTINMKGTVLYVTPAEHATYHGLLAVGLVLAVVSALYRISVRMRSDQSSP